MADRETIIRESLARASREAGTRAPLWTQGAGGNISYKTARTLWVKASGVRLDAVTAETGICRLPLPLSHSLPVDEAAYEQLLLRHSTAERPSMETGFHSEASFRWVIHLHSLVAISLAHQFADRESALRQLCRRWTKRSLRIVGWAIPGLELWRKVSLHAKAEILLLRNHGVILRDPSPQSTILAEWAALEIELCRELGWSDLESLCRAERPGLIAERSLPSFDFRWRRCFPDAAVFEERVTAEFRFAGNGGLRWKKNFRDQDAAEIAAAVALLQRTVPGLPELPSRSAQAVRALPSEKFRRSK